VYQGLDIITNKVTKEERLMCQHHMIDFMSPLKSNYTITDFKNTSLQIVSFSDYYVTEQMASWLFGFITPSWFFYCVAERLMFFIEHRAIPV
jgi:hypothetical protein